MPYGFIMLAALSVLFAFSIITPKYLEPWWNNRVRRSAYNSLKWDIIHNGSAENKEWFERAIIGFETEYGKGYESVMLREFLEAAVNYDVDFKKELGI